MTIHFNENEKIHNRVTQFDTLGRLDTTIFYFDEEEQSVFPSPYRNTYQYYGHDSIKIKEKRNSNICGYYNQTSTLYLDKNGFVKKIKGPKFLFQENGELCFENSKVKLTFFLNTPQGEWTRKEVGYLRKTGYQPYALFKKQFNKRDWPIERKMYFFSDTTTFVEDNVYKYSNENEGDLIYIKTFHPHSNTTYIDSISYEYDLHRNWIQKTTSSGSTISRIITYY